MAKRETAIVGRILQKGDCFYIFPKEEYSHNMDYYIIVSHKQIRKLKVGDTVIYEPYGVNFGIFVSKWRRSVSRKKSLSR